MQAQQKASRRSKYWQEPKTDIDYSETSGVLPKIISDFLCKYCILTREWKGQFILFISNKAFQGSRRKFQMKATQHLVKL